MRDAPHDVRPSPLRADPTLKVKYVSYKGQRLANTEQSEYGLKLGSLNLNVVQAQAGKRAAAAGVDKRALGRGPRCHTLTHVFVASLFIARKCAA